MDDFVPIRCLIPDHLRRIGQTQQWLSDQVGIPKSQLSDYIHMRYMIGIVKAKQISFLLKLRRIDDLYLWDRHGE